MTLTGMTWGHIRAMDPLVASAREYSNTAEGCDVDWQVRDLRDFEHQSLADIVRRVDMVVFDHPHCGMLAQQGLFVPLDALDALSAEHDADFIGSSLSSYRYQNKQWGAPVDGATNHAVYRADLLARLGLPLPQSWQQALVLGEAARRQGLYLAMAANAHHGLLAVAALCANMGNPWREGEREGTLEIHRRTLAQAVDWLDKLMAFCPPQSIEWNSIALHNQMSLRDDLVYCPCVYGFAVYGEPGIYQHPLSFAGFAGVRAPYHAGSVLGGAAIGLSRYSRRQPQALRYLDWLMVDATQRGVIAGFHGQPGRVEAWNSPALDKKFNGFFSAVRPSMESAWMRPRYAGYQEFETRAGALLESHLRGRVGLDDAVDGLLALAVAHPANAG
ncbi:extracellular solute-binding protein [Sodalis sp. dw_96]|uniref:extracellular solute-binding protein n=1 Tax=Sodalis sp. dw_96 TaxID=2719794 RepID=UPI001BD542D0|nr:extracellular solute-binding protein [Sodalis sp. dw_96]